MAQLIDLYFKKETLKTLFETLEKKGEKGISLTVSVNDDTRPNASGVNYQQNVSATVAQSKEERDAGKNKFYVANGKTFWAGNGEFVPQKYDPNAGTAQAPNTATDDNAGDVDDLPF